MPTKRKQAPKLLTEEKSFAWFSGQSAHNSGYELTDNPHAQARPELAAEWRAGWLYAAQVATYAAEGPQG